MATGDRRRVKPTFARLLPNFPAAPAAPTPTNQAPLDSNFHQRPRIKTIISVLQQELRVGGRGEGGGGEKNKTSW